MQESDNPLEKNPLVSGESASHGMVSDSDTLLKGPFLAKTRDKGPQQN